MFTFIESKVFSRLRDTYLTDDDYGRLQEALIADPDSGPVIRGSGGIRKLRWSQPGRGKRGGVRIIYYAKIRDGLVYLLTIYAKNEEETIPAHILRKIKEELDG